MAKRLLCAFLCIAMIVPMFCLGTTVSAENAANLALSATASASSYDTGANPPSVLNDGKNNGEVTSEWGRWTPVYNEKEKWAQLAWNEAVTFNRVVVMEFGKNEKFTETQDDVRAAGFYLAVSNDGENFETIHTGTTIGQKLVIDLDKNVTAKWLRIYLTATSHKWAPAVLREIEVYQTSEPTYAEGFVYDKDLTDAEAEAPAAWGATPKTSQYEYAKQEMCAFLHFSINTMTGREWGNETEVVSDFNLTTEADFDGYVKMLKEAGFKRLIFTAKHHDGFCMWPSKYTDFDIEGTEYYKLYGDPLEAISAACTRYDMEMGLYLSPWDMHNKDYADAPDKYLEYWINQFKEIISNKKYGCNGVWKEIWLDGACGSAYVKPEKNLDIKRMFTAIREQCSDIDISGITGGETLRPDIILSANEKGASSNDSWQKWACRDCLFYNHGTHLGVSGYPQVNYEYDEKIRVVTGYPGGNHWSVIESDVSLTPGWFWGKNKAIPKTPTELRDIYYRSTGHNSVLLINIPLDDNGQITPEIRTSVETFGRNVKESFATNLLEGATASATSVYGDDIAYSASKTLDGSEDTYYASKEQAATLLYELNSPITFDAVRISEEIRLGQRVNSLTISYKNTSGNWIKWYEAPVIGSLRIAAGVPVTATAIKIAVSGLNESALPIITEVGAYKVTTDFELGSGVPNGLDVIDNAENSSAFSASSACETADSMDSIGGSYINVPAGESVNVSFNGTFAYIYGGSDNNTHFSVSVDGGTPKTLFIADGTLGKVIGETDTLEDGTHTVKITAIDGNVKLDAVCVLNNGGKGLIEFEHNAYTISEDNTYDVKLVRKGGSTGALNVIVNDEPGSAVQYHYVTTQGIPVTFASGETEKTVSITTQRYTEKTGTLTFYLKMVANGSESLVTGFNSSATVSIADVETEFTNGFVNSINIVKQPNKTNYVSGESADISGIEVEADIVAAAPIRKTIYTGTTIGDNSSTKAEDHVKTIKYATPISANEFTMYTIFGASISEIEFYNSIDDPELENNLAKNVTRTYQSSVHRWNPKECLAKMVIDGDRTQNHYAKRWNASATPEEDRNPWFRLVWENGVTFDTIVIYEFTGSVKDEANNNYESKPVFVTDFTFEVGIGDTRFTKVVPENSLTVSPEKIRKTTQSVTVSYEDKSASFDISVTESTHALVYDGFSVRTRDYNGMRSVFYFDDTVEKAGYTIKEYGTVAVATSNKPNDDEFLKVDGENISPADNKILKTEVYKDGVIVNKTLESDTDGKYAGMTKFGFTITNFADGQYENKVYVCGYEVWENDETGELEIVYTEYANPNYIDISIYDLSLGMYKAGVLNSANEDGTVWSVLESGAVTLKKGSDYTVRSEGMTDWNGNPIGDTFTYKNIPAVNQAIDNDTKVLSFTESGIYITLLRDGSDYVAVYRGKGDLPEVSWGHRVSQLHPQFTESTKSDRVSKIEGNSPAPILTSDASNKIKTVILDDGVTGVSGYGFNLASMETVVYPKTLKSLIKEVFIGAKKLSTVFMAGTAPETGLADISSVETVKGAYMFNGCASLKKVHLPANASLGGNNFENMTSLDGVWFGNGEYLAGTADFSQSTSITSIENAMFSGATGIRTVILNDRVKLIKENAFNGLSGICIIQPTKCDAIEKYCSDNGYSYKHQFETNTYTGTHEGREYTVIKPSNANGNWVWRTEFLGIYDYADKALKNLG